MSPFPTVSKRQGTGAVQKLAHIRTVHVFAQRFGQRSRCMYIGTAFLPPVSPRCATWNKVGSRLEALYRRAMRPWFCSDPGPGRCLLRICSAAAVLVQLAASAQDNYEIQVYGAETVPTGSTMVELHSNYAIDGQR